MTPTPTRPAPQSLAEVKAGDVVARCWSVYRELATVTRVTPTQIICGDWRFKAADGYRIGSSSLYRGEHISLDRSDILRARKSAARAALSAPVVRLDQGAVMEKRAACDAAEAALREAGEWTDGE